MVTLMGDRTKDLSILSLMLLHYSTALLIYLSYIIYKKGVQKVSGKVPSCPYFVNKLNLTCTVI